MIQTIIEAVIYDRFFEIQRRSHESYEAAAGTAVKKAGTPWWIKLRDEKQARSFFCDFIREKLGVDVTGTSGRRLQWVATRAAAAVCAEEYRAWTHAKGLYTKISARDMVAYYLPPGVVPLMPSPGTVRPVPASPLPYSLQGELRRPEIEDYPVLIQWVKDFYRETLQMEAFEGISDETAETSEEKSFQINEPDIIGRPALYVWARTPGGVADAMGVLTNAAVYEYEGEAFSTRRLNLIFVPKENRRAGYGRAVVSALCEVVRSGGCLPMLYAYGDNTAAVVLYEGLGFTEAGRLVEVTPEAVSADGVLVTCPHHL